MTVTRTATVTMTRSDLIGLQLGRILQQAGIDADLTGRIRIGIERKWIEAISVFAVDGDGAVLAELGVTVDWTRHELAIASAREMLDDADPERASAIETGARLFAELRTGRDLALRLRVTYVGGVDIGMANEAIGLVPLPVRPIANVAELMIDVNLLDSSRDPAAGNMVEHPSRPATASTVAGERLFAELERLGGHPELDGVALERAALIVTAEQSWRSGLGVMLDEQDVARLLDVDGARVAELDESHELITLVTDDGCRRFPAFQFQNGRTTPALARAHRTIVTVGRMSAWSATSWARTSHPELDARSPAQWVAEHRDDATLMLVAERDATRLAQ